MKYNVILLAAGRGSRSGLSYNKVFYRINDSQTVLDFSLDLFLGDPDCTGIIIVCAENEVEKMKEEYCRSPLISTCIGGNTRQESVYNGLCKVNADYVFIHDGARPYVKREQIEDLKKTLQTEDACLLMVPSTDTSKIVENGYVKETLIRSTVYNAQTPQCFKTDLIKYCYQKGKEENREATDDAQLVEWYSDVPVKMVLSDPSNIKITHPTDLKN